MSSSIRCPVCGVYCFVTMGSGSTVAHCDVCGAELPGRVSTATEPVVRPPQPASQPAKSDPPTQASKPTPRTSAPLATPAGQPRRPQVPQRARPAGRLGGTPARTVRQTAPVVDAAEIVEPVRSQATFWVATSCSALAFFVVALGGWFLWSAIQPGEHSPLDQQVAALPESTSAPPAAEAPMAAPPPAAAAASPVPPATAGSAPSPSADTKTAPPANSLSSTPDNTGSVTPQPPVAPPIAPPAVAESAAPSRDDEALFPAEPPAAAHRRGFAEPESEPPADWRVEVDPVTEPLVFEKDLSIPVGGHGGEILFPTTPSPYALVGKPKLLELWDLRTGSKIRSVKADHPALADMRMSAEGAYVASWNPGRGTGASVLVGKLRSNKASTIEVGPDRTFDDFFDFGPPGQLFARAGKDSLQISVWDIEKGEPLHKIPTGARVDKLSPAVSPGRRYLAWVEDELELVIANLESGQIAGRAIVPGKRPKCRGMVFSHDGSLLAGFFEVFPKSALYCWDVASGRLLDTFELEPQSVMRLESQAMHSRLMERPLEWLADKSAWLLFGYAIFHREQGKVIYTFPPPEFGETVGPRRILDERRAAGLIGPKDKRLLGVATLPTDEMASGSEIVSRGGSVSDVGLPQLTEPDTSAATLVALGSASGWKVQADPAPAQATGVRAQTLVSAEFGSGGAPLISADGSRAIIWGAKGLTHGPRPPPHSESASSGLLAIDSYDLQTRKRICSVSLKYKGRVLAATADGSRVAVSPERTIRTEREAKTRIDVYSLPDGKPVAGWRPYDRDALAFRNYTTFVGPNMLVTGGWDVPLTAWSLPDCRAVYLIPDAQPRQLSPGGKYLVVTARSGVHFVEAASGQPVGTIHLADDVTATAINARGTKLAVATGVAGSITTSGLATGRLRTWDIATGKPEYDFAVPISAGTIEWCGDDHLLLENRSLIRLEDQGIVWNYHSLSTSHTSVGAHHWWLTATGTNQYILCRTELPDAAPRNAPGGSLRADQGLLRPGMRISLQVNLAGVHSSVADLPKRVAEHFQQGLEKNGFVVGPGGEMTLTVSATIANTNEKVQIRQAITQQTQEAYVKIMTCEVALTRGSEKLWGVSQRFGNRNWGLVTLRQGQTLDDLFSEVLWSSGAEKYFFQIATPKQIYPESAMAVVGQSDLTPR